MGQLNELGYVSLMTLSTSLLTLSIPSVLRTFRRRPALKMRPWHLVSANLRDLKIGYPCSLRFTCDESYTVHLLFSTKSRLGGLPGGGAPLQRDPEHRGSEEPRWVEQAGPEAPDRSAGPSEAMDRAFALSKMRTD